MFRFSLILSIIVFFSCHALLFAQARRIPPRSAGTDAAAQTSSPTDSDEKTPAAMYDDTKTYAKRKFEEFAARKVPYSVELREATSREQKQLAAKYAAQLNTQNLSGEDFYYLGSLQALAENNDGASEAFEKYLSSPKIDDEKAQTARSLVAVTLARKRDFAAAEKYLNDYLKGAPVKVLEQTIVERELAKNYRAVKKPEKAAFYAESAVSAAQSALKDSTVDARLLEEFTNVGFLLFNIYAETNANAKAEKTLNNLLETAVAKQSINLYLEAVDKLVTFLIETGRKPQALENLKQNQSSLQIKFRDKSARAYITTFFKRRENQYRLLGETAPEIAIDSWVSDSGAQISMANQRGKVVLLDFWATWCKPCFSMFPKLTEWQETFGQQGLQIVGVTRYYGQADGFKADDAAEYAFLQKFKREQRLPYALAIAKDESNHRAFAADGIPTTILIDKKGVIRLIETGTGFEKAIEAMIEKLLAEN